MFKQQSKNQEIENIEIDSNNLLVKQFENLDIPLYGTYEEPLFKAKDIGILLDIKDINSKIRDYSEHHKCMLKQHTVRGEKEVQMLTELGLYKVAMTSKSNKVEPFQNWIFNVIKEIRLTGKYELENRVKQIESVYLSQMESFSIITVVLIIENKYHLINSRNEDPALCAGS